MIVPRLHTLALFGLSLLFAGYAVAAIPEAQRSKIDQVTGVKGVYTAEEDVYRVNFPRTDVKVAIEGREMHPFLGLTSWAAFTPHSQSELMVMGDLVLFEDEVNPVMSLHNHFFFDSPRVMFMHIGGSGTAEQLATAVARAGQGKGDSKSESAASGRVSRFCGSGGKLHHRLLDRRHSRRQESGERGHV